VPSQASLWSPDLRLTVLPPFRLLTFNTHIAQPTDPFNRRAILQSHTNSKPTYEQPLLLMLLSVIWHFVLLGPI
jgi:hypothetical protein